MKLSKCPHCELNYIKEDETICAVCKKGLTGTDVEETEMCIECGEREALPGEDLCRACLRSALGKAVSAVPVIKTGAEPEVEEEEEEETVIPPVEEVLEVEVLEEELPLPEDDDVMEVPMALDEEEDIDEDEEELEPDQR